MSSESSRVPPRQAHAARRDRFRALVAKLERDSNRISVVNLAFFLAALASIANGATYRSLVQIGAGVFFAICFGAAYVVQAIVLARRDRAKTREQIHSQHLARIEGETRAFPSGTEFFGPEHPYADDLDIVGQGSIFQRIDVTHTKSGAETLATWLGAPADEHVIDARQSAVRELSEAIDFREALEAAVLDTGDQRLDATPFLALAERPLFMLARPWLVALAIALPLVTLTVYLLSDWFLPAIVVLAPLAGHAIVLWRTQEEVGERYGLLSGRLRFVESFAALLRVVEEAEWHSEALRALQERLKIDGVTPSAQLRRLSVWTSLFDLRTQGLFHFVVNFATLWDLHCLAGVEYWLWRTGRKARVWFEVLGEIEALAALATLLHQDPDATMPTIAAPGSPVDAHALAHALIRPEQRVHNDVMVPGPGTALVVTGSNMAGKSTLLRALGLNLALALAGGPVIAKRFSTGPVRLRASMRVSDSVQAGASYFQAELIRLRTVIGDAEHSPPIFFLLDELLRGTNARARHKGARAVIRHLLARGGFGLVATHDIALSDLEGETDHRVTNVHFTDVFADGEMLFDYLLRPGVVKTSNALRLLRQAGVEVDADDSLGDEFGPVELLS